MSERCQKCDRSSVSTVFCWSVVAFVEFTLDIERLVGGRFIPIDFSHTYVGSGRKWTKSFSIFQECLNNACVIVSQPCKSSRSKDVIPTSSLSRYNISYQQQ